MGLSPARATAPDDLHMTLRFLGETPPQMLEPLDETLTATARRVAPFELTLDAVVASPGRARMAWAIPSNAPDALARLHAQVERAARAAGAQPDPRRFRPHITLARATLHSSARAADFGASIARAQLEPIPWRPTAIALMEARPGGGGPYVSLRRFPLEDDSSARSAPSSIDSISSSDIPK